MSYKFPRVGVAIIVLYKGKILLGKRKNLAGNGHYACPGGHLEYGESIEQCAIRELKEETGITPDNLRFYKIKDTLIPELNRHYVTIFMVSDYNGDEISNMEPDMCEGWDWFDLDNLPKPTFNSIDMSDLRSI